jgi:hypothetical protein
MAAPNIKSNGSSAYHTLGYYKSINGGGYTAVHSSAAPHGLTNWRFNGETLWYANATLIQIDNQTHLNQLTIKYFIEFQ